MDDRNTTYKRSQTTGPDNNAHPNCGSQDDDNLTAACAGDKSLKATHDGKAMASVYTVGDAHDDLCSTSSHVPEESSQMMQPKPPDKSSDSYAPPDGGYGWVIVTSAFTVYLLLGGWRRSYTLFLIEIKETFHTTTGVAAWIGGAASAGIHILSPISAFLVHQTSTRVVVVMGAILLSLSSLLSAFSPQAEFLFFSYSLLTGFGGSCVLGPTLVIITQYFSKRRGIAHGLASSGGGFGGFLLPLLMEYMFIEYSFSGCLIITSAVLLNITVSGCLMRSLPDHYRGLQKCITKTSLPEKQVKVLAPTKEEHFSKPPSSFLNKVRNSETYLQYKSVCTVRFALFLLSMGLGLGVLVVSWILLTDFATHRGVPLTSAVLLTSIGSIVDLVFRILVGVVFDFKVLRQYCVLNYNLILLLNGVVMLLLAFTYTYYVMLLLVMLQYVCSAVMMAQRQVVIVDLFGVDTLLTTVPFTLMVQGVGVLILPAVLGFLFDMTGSYVLPYIVAGTLGILSAITFRISMLPSLCGRKSSLHEVDVKV